MKRIEESPVRAKVDLSNPGKFFACCGLLELADRLWNGAEGWFEKNFFYLRPIDLASRESAALANLIEAIAAAPLIQLDPDDSRSSPGLIGAPFELELNWWLDKRGGGQQLKIWAGSMRGIRIARAMQRALRDESFHDEQLFDRAIVIRDAASDNKKKIEPFYFDSRRGANALPLDIGFSPDPFHMTIAAHPAVEFLCLAGLQRCRPLPARRTKVFAYFTWTRPLEARLAPAAVCGLLPWITGQGFRFENAFRTDKRLHKAFMPATPLKGIENE